MNTIYLCSEDNGERHVEDHTLTPLKAFTTLEAAEKFAKNFQDLIESHIKEHAEIKNTLLDINGVRSE